MHLNIFSRKANQLLDINSLIAEHYQMVYRCCYAFLYNRQDAEDVCQEVFIAVNQSLASFKHQSKVSTWITRIAINKSLNHIRANQKYSGDLEVEGVDIPTEDFDGELTLIQQRAIVKSLIEQLPEKQRVAFVMNKYNGFSAQEIAEIQGCSVNSVEVLIHRAFKSINKQAIEIYKQQEEVKYGK